MSTATMEHAEIDDEEARSFKEYDDAVNRVVLLQCRLNALVFYTANPTIEDMAKTMAEIVYLSQLHFNRANTLVKLRSSLTGPGSTKLSRQIYAWLYENL